MDADSKRKWIVQDESGRVRGPYSTRALLQQISQGKISETHEVARYPGGEWQAISKNPEFYDRLLETLEKELEKNSSDDSQFISTDETAGHVTRPGRAFREEGEPDGDEDFVMSDPTTPLPDEDDGLSRISSVEGLSQEDSNVLNLDDKSQIMKGFKIKKFWKPLLVLTIGFFALVVFFFWPTAPKGRVHLRAPAKKGAKMDKKKFSQSIRKAYALFQKDDFQSYWRAQNTLVSVVGSRPKSKIARSLLCATYRELWVYSFQDRADTEVFSQVARTTRRMDPNGKHGMICEAAFALSQGKFQKAQNVVEAALPQNVREPLFYEMRASIWEHQKNIPLALDYLRTIQNIEPKWIKPYRLQSELLMKAGKTSEAFRTLQVLLKRAPNHPIANIEMGALYHEFFNKDQEAMNHIALGLEKGKILPPLVKVRGYKTMANVHLKSGDKEKALQFFKKAYRFNPNDIYVQKMLSRLGAKDVIKSKKSVNQTDRLALAEHYERQGDCFSAWSEYAAVFEADNKNARAAFKAASCLWKLSQAKDAITWLDKALKADPRYIEAYVKKAEFYTERYDFKEATRVLRRAMKLSPKNHVVFRGLAKLELKRNDYTAAENYAKRAINIYRTDVDSIIILVRALLGAGKYQKAYEEAVQLRSLDPANTEVQEVYVRSYAKIRDLRSAFEVVRELMESFPYTLEYRFLFGQLLKEDERFADAEGIFKQVLQLDEKYKPAMLELGRTVQALGKFNEARDLFLRAASLDPSDPRALFYLGKLYLTAGNPKSALIQFHRVLQNNPLYPNAHYFAGQAALDARKLHRALREAKKEAELNPFRADPHILQGDIYFFLRDYANCISAYQKAIKLRDPTSDLYVRQARCYRLQGGLHTALQLLRTAELKEPGNPKVWKEMGAVCEMKENINCAIEAYRQYLTLAPNAADRAIIEERVRKIIGR